MGDTGKSILQGTRKNLQILLRESWRLKIMPADCSSVMFYSKFYVRRKSIFKSIDTRSNNLFWFVLFSYRVPSQNESNPPFRKTSSPRYKTFPNPGISFQVNIYQEESTPWALRKLQPAFPHLHFRGKYSCVFTLRLLKRKNAVFSQKDTVTYQGSSGCPFIFYSFG